MDPKIRVSDVVRAALAVATKLEIPELREWCQREIKGYKGEEVPPYRRVEGQLRATNPLRGLIPVAFEDAAVTKALASRIIVQSVGELEEIYEGGESSDVLEMPLSAEVMNRFFVRTEEYQLGIIPTVILSRGQLFGVLDAVRNVILEWSLRLEKDGILGEGLTFSAEEKRKAESITYNVGQFTGVLGDVHSSTIHIGEYNSIHAELKRLGVSQDQRNDLEEILDKLPPAHGEQRTSLVQRGKEWLIRNGPTIGTLSDTIRGWLEYFARSAAG